MGKIYSNDQNVSRPRKACPATVEFLINYSKSLHIITYNTIKFENNLN